ncbi:MAG: formate dehydrogenase accessory sulfurtransferase FdhD [Leptospirales bacterium]|nr:formate dehydrogenase accessory sulfurtransferase FdhD [Leptospirales bacterium]
MDTAEVDIIKYKTGDCRHLIDIVVREEPLDIIINGEKKYFCMRMPGMDWELAIGLLYNEGIINSLNDIEKFDIDKDRISFEIKGEITGKEKKIYSSSGGTFSDEIIAPFDLGHAIDRTRTIERAHSMRPNVTFGVDEIFSLQKTFFEMQKNFDKTGGTHASAFYSSNGELIAFAEDVGRHNALDKCMGIAIKSDVFKNISLVMLSSRISFEMIKKSFRTGACVVAGVSAPTSAAIQAAKDLNMTLIGFLRDGRFNVYSHYERISGIDV